MRWFVTAAGVAGVVLAVAFGMPSAALSQEDGVTLDSGDPAAKEYALPHEQARREAAGDSDAPIRQGSRDSALFGEGVSRSGDAKADEAAGVAKSGQLGSAAGDSSGPGSTTAILGGGAAVLFVALLGGFALRALRGPQGP